MHMVSNRVIENQNFFSTPYSFEGESLVSVSYLQKLCDYFTQAVQEGYHKGVNHLYEINAAREALIRFLVKDTAAAESIGQFTPDDHEKLLKLASTGKKIGGALREYGADKATIIQVERFMKSFANAFEIRQR